MSLYASLFRPKATPQSEPMDARQVANNAGGYVFAIDDWARLDRFLVLGSDAPTYYQSARALTRENAKAVLDCLAADAARAVARIVEISVSGRAPKQDPAIFALALATLDEKPETRALAYAAVPKVCRTATHLFQFVATAKALGKGFGRGMKRAVAAWYDDKPVEAIAYQAIKYRSREGFDHERLLDMARPDAHVGEAEYDALYRWMIGKEYDAAKLHPLVSAHLAAMQAENAAELLPLIAAHRLPWEALPTWANADPEVWRAMLPHLGLTALIRNLGNMTRIGAIQPLDGSEQAVAAASRRREGARQGSRASAWRSCRRWPSTVRAAACAAPVRGSRRRSCSMRSTAPSTRRFRTSSRPASGISSRSTCRARWARSSAGRC